MQRHAELYRRKLPIRQRWGFSQSLDLLQIGIALGRQIQGTRSNVQAGHGKARLQPRRRRFAAAAAQIQNSSTRRQALVEALQPQGPQSSHTTNTEGADGRNAVVDPAMPVGQGPQEACHR